MLWSGLSSAYRVQILKIEEQGFSLTYTHFNALSVPNELNLIHTSLRYYGGFCAGDIQGNKNYCFHRKLWLLIALDSAGRQLLFPVGLWIQRQMKRQSHTYTQSIPNGAQALTQHPRTLSATHFHCLIYFCVSS